MDLDTEYWVYKGDRGVEQARVIAVFDDLEACKAWCEDEYGEYDYGRDGQFPVSKLPEPDLEDIGPMIFDVVRQR